MAASARIDELRSKFDDNPRRYFAPLANEYRKAGDLGTAIAICRTQLRQFPSHMSGHVVLGQALYEAGEFAEARTVFERAVELDPENLIALRHLGDIARALGDDYTARVWYRRVLDADPYNDQIAALIDGMSPEPAASQQEPAADVGQLSEVASWPPPAELATEAPAAPEAEPEPAEADSRPRELEFVDFSADDFAWGAEPTPAEPAPAEPPELDVPEIDVPEIDVPEIDVPLDPVVGLDLVPTHDAAAEQLDHAAPSEPVVAEPAREPWIPEEGAPLDLVTSDAFATETMAELCLEQGHEDEALAIYDRLAAQRPEDNSLAERARALRARLHPDEPEQKTAGDFFGMLARRPEPEAPAAEPAEPAYDEHEAEVPESPEASSPEPVEASERDAWAADAWAGAFRPDAAPSEPLVTELLDRQQVTTATPPIEPAPSADASDRAESAVPEEEDLAEFNAWLKGLRDS